MNHVERTLRPLLLTLLLTLFLLLTSAGAALQRRVKLSQWSGLQPPYSQLFPRPHPRQKCNTLHNGHARFEDTVRLQRIACTLSILLLFTMTGKPQAQSRQPAPTPPPSPKADVMPGSNGNDAQERLSRDMAKKANLQRQAAIKADTDKLLKLAVELKDSVDKSNENLLSLDVLKKAEEIEKLAHSVKDKMKGPN
jgi:hypothetical protein